MWSKNSKRAYILIASLLLLAGICWEIDIWQKEYDGEQKTVEKEKTEELQITANIYGQEYKFCAWYDTGKEAYSFSLPGYLNEKIEKEAAGTTGKDAQAEHIPLSDIPTVYIETKSGDLNMLRESKENKDDVELSIFTKDSEMDEKCLQGSMKARGNASFHSPRLKKSYTIELKEKKGLLQFAESNKWLLLAHYFDDTHLLDYLTFDMARQLDMAYVPKGEWVNLFVDGDFQGIYLLCEKIEVGEGKIDIRNMQELQKDSSPDEAIRRFPYSLEGERGGREVVVEKGFLVDDVLPDISGGYLLELEYDEERYNEEPSGFISDAKQFAVIISPKYASVNQVAYIKNKYQEFEDALERSTEEGTEEFLAYIDLDSFVKKYLVEEVSKNMDANFSSQYLYKDSDTADGRFYAGPVWDYDRGYDNRVGDVNNRGVDKFWANQAVVGTDFWKRLYDNPVFYGRVKELYTERLSPVLNEYADATLESWGDIIHDSVIADMKLYREEYEEEMDEEERLRGEMDRLAQFIRDRKRFLDSEWKE